MRILVRVIAVWEGMVAAAMSLLVALLLAGRGLRANTLRGWVVVLGLLALPLLSGVAAVQLWRLRPTGRHASIALAIVFVIISLAQGGILTPRHIAGFAVCAVLVGILMSPSAARACARHRSASSPT